MKIMIKNEDRTDEVESYKFEGDKCKIKYYKSDTIYNNFAKDVKIYNTTGTEVFNYLCQLAEETKVAESDHSALKVSYDNILYCQDAILGKFFSGARFRTLENSKPLIFPFRFNKSQYEATEKALTNGLSVIEGPPGTGKTQTILNIISNALINNQSVAIVSNNIAAVENVRDKLKKNNYDFLFAQLGSKSHRLAFFDNYEKEVPDIKNWRLDDHKVETLMERVLLDSKAINLLLKKENRIKELIEEKRRLDKELQYFRRFYDSNGFVTDKKYAFLTANFERVLSFIVDIEEKRITERKNTLIDKIQLFLKHGFYKYNELENNEIEVISNYHVQYYKLKLNRIDEEISQLESELTSSKFAELKDRHCDNSKQIFEHYLSHRFKKTKGNYSNDNFKKNLEEFISDFPVILSTTYSISNCLPKNGMFDLVIVDEASTVDIVKGVLAMSCAKQIVFVGDLKQLPHIPIESKLKAPDVNYDNQKHSILSSIRSIYDNEVSSTLLKEHYRCHPDIIRFCNLKFYNNELLIFNDYNNKSPVTVINTQKGNHSREHRIGDKGLINIREIAETEDLVNNIIAQNQVIDVLTNPKHEFGFEVTSPDDIGFATPFRKQANEAKEVLLAGIETDTVHKYQGREKKLMVFSTVLDKTRVAQVKKKFVTDPNLVNVAVSRAEKHLVVITDESAFQTSGDNIGDLIRYINYQDESNIKSGTVVSVFDLLYKDYSHTLTARLEKSKQYSSRFASERIVESLIVDVLKADEFSSFDYKTQLRLFHLIQDLSKCNDSESEYVKNNASVDFVIINIFDQSPVLVIEVDGFEYHVNKQEQIIRDEKKNSILEKYNIPLLRYRTDGSLKEEILRNDISKALNV